MKQLILATGLLLSACSTTDTPSTPTVLGVQLPASIGASEAMPVTVTVDLACGRYDGFTTERTRNRLSMQVRSVQPEETQCAAVVKPFTFTFTDPGDVARTHPFQVVVNGKVWGTVEVR